MAYLVGLLLLIEMVSCGTQRNPTAGSAKGTIVLEVVYEKAPKLAEAMYMDRMVASVFRAQSLVVQQDLERVGRRWRGELEVDEGSYTVVLEAYKLSKPKWKGSTDVNVRSSKTYPIQMRLVLQNTRPVSQAGEDQQVETGSTVLLDGRGSTDLDGDRLTYRWNAPVGIRLSNELSEQPQFTATAVGVYRFSLVVNDGYVDSAPDEVVVTVNRRPVADAGQDQQVRVGRFTVLDGRMSADPDGDELSYSWIGPEGIYLGGATSALPHFTPTEPGEYQFTLVVNDGYVDSAPDTVAVTVGKPSAQTVNQSPTANAGQDQSVEFGARVTLDGSSSSDPEGAPLTYRWTAPAGISLDVAAMRPQFVAESPGTYRFTLVVNDGTSDSDPDEVVIKVNAPTTGDAQIVGEIQENTGDAQVIGTIEEDTGDAEIFGDVQE